jgi:pimeloyl-ACP methyl ester carboxylesterase
VTDFVLIPGAGGNASYWTWLVPELAARGHQASAVDIPQDDPTLGLADWADVVVQAIGDRRDVVLVAQSLGGFTAPMVAARVPVRMIVMVNAMVPLRGERPDEWWTATDSGAARQAADEAAGRDPEFSLDAHFFHDVPPDRLAELMAMPPPREPSATAMASVCEFTTWPDQVRVVVGRDDRFFPADFQRQVAQGRLGLEVDEVPGGHLAAISYPAELAAKLDDLAPS